MVEHTFVLPKKNHLPSGGNLYNSFLIRALKNKGVSLKTVDINQALQERKKDKRGWIWVDSLCLDRIPLLLEAIASGQRIFLIVHHLPSFEPDLSQAEHNKRVEQEKEILSEITGFLVTSSYVENLICERGFKDKAYVKVLSGLCLKSELPREGPKKFRGLRVANLIAQKGALEFLSKLENEIRPEDDFIINIAGRQDIEPDYAQSFFEFISGSSKLKKSIRFLGPLSLKQLGELYVSSSALISASKMETYGMAVKDALSCGLPVLAYDGGYVRIHIQQSGGNGLLFSTFKELAGLCVQFIRHPKELYALRNRTEVWGSAKDHSWKKAADRFVEQTSLLMKI